MDSDVEKWMKRLAKKGPFFLLKSEPWTSPHAHWQHGVRTGTAYTVIWHDQNKGDVKIGTLHDWMTARYGIQTRAALKGDRPHDLWNGRAVEDGEFEEMLAVWEDRSTLPHFDITTLKNVEW